MNAQPKQPPPRKEAFKYIIKGVSYRRFTDVYHFLLRISWLSFIFLVTAAYVCMNAIFANLYLLGGDCIEGIPPGSFIDAFWFSVQTLSTIGYGGMAPHTVYAHILVTVESFAGLTSLALGTGLLFAKFSRPSTRVVFSRNMIVHNMNGIPCLMFRMANERKTQIVQASLVVSVAIKECTSEGISFTRFHSMKLERSSTPMFALSWTAIHQLTPDSPLFEIKDSNVKNRLFAIAIILTGVDDTFSQSVHARHLYFPENILFERRFVDMITTTPEGNLSIDHTFLHDTKAICS